MIQQKYSNARIQLLYQMLLNSQQQGHPREYDIRVDELKVVQRTSDPEEFMLHEQFILPDTQTVTIIFYEGTSNRNTRHVFVLNEPPNEKQSKGTLEGLEDRMDEKITSERRKWEFEQLQKENESLKDDLAETEQCLEDLQQKYAALNYEFDEFKKKRIGLAEMNTGKIVGVATEYLSKNPSVIKKIPLISVLSGFLNDDEQIRTELLGSAPGNSMSAPESQASFTKKSNSEVASDPEYDGITKKKLAFFKAMEDAFNVKQLNRVVDIINKLIETPEQIDTICELLDISETESQP